MKTVLSLVGTAGVDIDGADGEAKTGLYWAAFGGNLGVVEFLVGKGAVVDKAMKDGWTPLVVAAFEGHLGVVEFLVGHGAVVDKAMTDGFTPSTSPRRRATSASWISWWARARSWTRPR